MAGAAALVASARAANLLRDNRTSAHARDARRATAVPTIAGTALNALHAYNLHNMKLSSIASIFQHRIALSLAPYPLLSMCALLSDCLTRARDMSAGRGR